MKNKNDVYLPDVRSYSKAEKHSLISESPEGISTTLPSPVEDAIVVNNIASQEFDYTEDAFDESE